MYTNTDFPDYYKLLGVSCSASPETIKKRIRVLCLQWHPDVCKDPQANDMTVKILEAKGILLDNDLRREYDEKLNRPASFYGDTEWNRKAQGVYEQARKEADLSLGELLEVLAKLIIGVTAEGIAIVAKEVENERKFRHRVAHIRSLRKKREKAEGRFVRKEKTGFGQLFWGGIGCGCVVICIIIFIVLMFLSVLHR